MFALLVLWIISTIISVVRWSISKATNKKNLNGGSKHFPFLKANISTGQLSGRHSDIVWQLPVPTSKHYNNCMIIKCLTVLQHHPHTHTDTRHGIITDGNFPSWHSVACHRAPFPAKSEPAEPGTHIPLGGPSIILSPAAGRHIVVNVRSDSVAQDVRETRDEVSLCWWFIIPALRMYEKSISMLLWCRWFSVVY